MSYVIYTTMTSTGLAKYYVDSYAYPAYYNGYQDAIKAVKNGMDFYILDADRATYLFNVTTQAEPSNFVMNRFLYNSTLDTFSENPNYNIEPLANFTDNPFHITNTTSAALIVDGRITGKEVVSNTFVSSNSLSDSTNINTGSIIGAGGLGVGKTAYIGNELHVLGVANATSKDSGAVVIENGGLGVELDTHIGGSLTVGDSVTVNGSTSSTTKDTGALIVSNGGVGVEGNISYGGQLISEIATGTSPFTVASATKVDNLNVDMLDGKHLSEVSAYPNIYVIDSSVITSYQITDTDGYYRFACNTTTAPISLYLPLTANNQGRRIEVANVGTGVLTVYPHPSEPIQAKLTSDGLTSIIFPKMGNTILFQESQASGYWLAVYERINSLMVADTETTRSTVSSTMILRFSNRTMKGSYITDNFGSYGGVSGAGHEATIQRSGKYSITFLYNHQTAATPFGISKNSSQLTTSINTINASDWVGQSEISVAAHYNVFTYIDDFVKGDVLRPHSHLTTITTTAPAKVKLIIEFLG